MTLRAERRLQAPTPRAALAIFAAIVICVVLYMGRGALAPFVIGLVLIYVLDPAVQWLVRRRVPPALAVLVVYLAAIVVLVQGLSLLLRPLLSQLGTFLGNLPEYGEALQGIRRAVEDLGLPAPISDAIDRLLAQVGEGAGTFDPGTLFPIVTRIAGIFGAVLAYLIVPVWAFYILKDRRTLVARVDQALPPAWRRDTWAVVRITERTFGRFLRGQLLLGLIVGFATFAGLIALGLLVDPRFTQFAVFLAVVAGVFELLPIIGPILAAIPAVLVALTISPQAVIGVLVLYVVVQQVENNVLVPKIQGDAIDLHPSVVIFALIMGGAIAGLLGAIFALPITAAARDVYRYLFRRLSEDDPAIPPAEGILEHRVGPAEAADPAPTDARPAEAAGPTDASTDAKPGSEVAEVEVDRRDRE